MAIPYQPGFSISPRYGFRYGASSHVPATTNNYVVPDNNIPPISSGTATSGGASKQPVTMGTGASDSGDDNSMQSDAMARSVAQSRGYNQVQGNPLEAAINMIPVAGPAISKQMGLQQDYGKAGTYDAQGNVFGNKGFAYDLRTGAPAASYKDRETFYNVRKDNYNTLRNLGQDPLQSMLNTHHGSYMDIPKEEQDYGASAAGRAGIDDTQSRLRHNTSIYRPDLIFNEPLLDGKPIMDFNNKPTDWKDRFTGKTKSEFLNKDAYLSYDLEEEESVPSPKDVTLESMGIDPKTHGGSGVRAFTRKRDMGMPALFADRDKLGTIPNTVPVDKKGLATTAFDYSDDAFDDVINTGDIVNTAFGPGVVNESGQVETSRGTVIQMSGVNDGKVIQKPTQQESSTPSGGK